MVAPSIWGAAGARGAGRAAWGGSRPGKVGRGGWGAGSRTRMGLSNGCAVLPPSFPLCHPTSSCRLSSTCPQEADAHSLSIPIKGTLCYSIGTSHCPQLSLCTFLPSLQTPRSSQLFSTIGFFPGAGGHGFILLSGRELMTGSATALLGNSGKFLNLPGPQFSPLQNGNNHGCSAHPMGLMGESHERLQIK